MKQAWRAVLQQETELRSLGLLSLAFLNAAHCRVVILGGEDCASMKGRRHKAPTE